MDLASRIEFSYHPSFCFSSRAGAVGINLTQANRVFLMEPAFNPALEAQAIGRVHRLGQKREVQIVRLVISDSFESRMMAFLKTKYGSDDSNNTDGDSEDADEGASGATAVVLAGNISREKAEVMTEEFDLLFGVNPKIKRTNECMDEKGTVPGPIILSL